MSSVPTAGCCARLSEPRSGTPDDRQRFSKMAAGLRRSIGLRRSHDAFPHSSCFLLTALRQKYSRCFKWILKNLLMQTSLLFLPGIRTGDHASWRKPKPPLVCQAPKPETANWYADTY